MNDLLFVVLIGTLGFLSSCLSIWKDYKDKRYKKRIFKGVKKEFYMLSVLGLIILSLTIWQYFYTRDRNKNEKKEEANEKRIKDSTMQAEIKKGIDSGIHMISIGFGNSFKEQKIKMDSINYTLVAIKDSVDINKQPEEKPTIGIMRNGISIDSFMSNNRGIHVAITSLGGSSTNIDIKISLIVLYANGKLIQEISNDNLIDHIDRIPNQTVKGTSFFIPKDAQINKIYVLLKGSYTNLNGKSKTFIDELYEFDVEMNSTIKMFNDKKIELLDKLKHSLSK